MRSEERLSIKKVKKQCLSIWRNVVLISSLFLEETSGEIEASG